MIVSELITLRAEKNRYFVYHGIINTALMEHTGKIDVDIFWNKFRIV